MSDSSQAGLFSGLNDLDFVRVLLADLHDDLLGKVGRLHQLEEISSALGAAGTMMPGGEKVLAAWLEARSSFVQGNYMATVMLCQSLVEHMLAAHLEMAMEPVSRSSRPSFRETLRRSVEQRVISEQVARDLEKLMEIRNPLSHYRALHDPSNLSRRVLDTLRSAESHLISDATFAISVTVGLLALRAFRLDG